MLTPAADRPPPSARGSGGPEIRTVWWFPPTLEEAQQTALSAAVQELPAKSGIVMANWNWKVVRQFVSERCGVSLTRSTCLNYLHRLGFALKRPKKRLLEADAGKREAFVAEYAALASQAQEFGERIFFADEAHFRADAELRGKWVLRGEPAPVFTRAGFGGLDQPALRREGQLPFGGVPGDRRGVVDGTGGEQQQRNVGSLPGAVAGEAQWSAERDLGQRSGPPGRGGAGNIPRVPVFGRAAPSHLGPANTGSESR